MRARPTGALAAVLALTAPAAVEAQPATVLVAAHSPDGAPVGPLVAEVVAELERRGFTVIDSGKAASKIGSPSSYEDLLAAAQRDIEIGERAYLDLELERAELAFHEALSRLDHLPGPAAFAATVLALERHALVNLAMGGKGDAEAALDHLYALEPAHKPDPVLVSPRFAPAFEAAAKRAQNAATRSVRVVTVPEGADVYVDGRAVGFAPLTVTLADGVHRFEARLSGHHPFAQTGAPADTDVTLRLAAATGDSDRVEVLREALASAVLPARRERFAAEICPRIGASAALVLTVRRGEPPSADLYRASQPAASLDRADGAEPIAAWAERKLRPPIAAVATPPATPRSPRANGGAKPSRWVWVAGAAVLSAAAGAAYASANAPEERTRVAGGEKTVRFGGGG